MATSNLLADLVRAQQLHLVDNVMANERIAREFGLRLADMQTLHLLLLRPEVTTARSIADAAGLPTSTVTDIIERLVKAGYVERRRDDADRRRVNLVLTAKTSHIVARYSDSGMGAQLQRAATTFTEAELETVLRWFDTLNNEARPPTEQ